jgi:hypothetical protein
MAGSTHNAPSPTGQEPAMKKMQMLSFAILFGLATTAAAQNLQCGKAFGFAVAQCQKALDSKVLPPKTRATAHKLCVSDARDVKQACLSGSGECIAQCEANMQANNQFCAANFDPAVVCPAADPICVATFGPIYASCLAQSAADFEACVAACP